MPARSPAVCSSSAFLPIACRATSSPAKPAASKRWACGSCSTTRSKTCWPNSVPAPSMPCTWPSARRRTEHVDIPGERLRAGVGGLVALAGRRRRRASQDRAARGDLRRRQYRHGCGAHGATTGRRRGGDRVPARPSPHARAPVRGRRSRRRGREDQVAERHQGHFRFGYHRGTDGTGRQWPAPRPPESSRR